MQFFRSRGVYTKVRRESHMKIIKTRWLDIKGGPRKSYEILRNPKTSKVRAAPESVAGAALRALPRGSPQRAQDSTKSGSPGPAPSLRLYKNTSGKHTSAFLGGQRKNVRTLSSFQCFLSDFDTLSVFLGQDSSLSPKMFDNHTRNATHVNRILTN